MSVHQISLADCLEKYAPPGKVLNISACDDTAFVRICTVDQDSQTEKHTEVAEISVSLPSLLEALGLLANDAHREDLRPRDSSADNAHETKLAGGRLTIAATGPSAAVGALTEHLRYTPAPRQQDAKPKAQRREKAG